MVMPTISGKIMEARDQVLMTRRSPLLLMRSTFFLSDSWMYGPFFVERDMITFSSCLRYGGVRCTYPSSYCDEFCNPEQVCPRESAAVRQSANGLHHHHADGRVGS